MGIVYRASDPTIGREVALKVLAISNSSSEEGTSSPQEMFMREVRAAGRLAHPAIVTIYDAFDDPENQTSCIVMELVPGLTLERILESGQPLTNGQIINLVRQVADGLDYAHRHQVIHRDLKPANILITAAGRVKITDFGIAKVLAREGAARTVGIVGTPSYMSPEQVKGGDIDARTDIFSLGIILFRMLTGKKPFSGNTVEVMFKIVYEEPPAPSTLNSQLPPAYDQVIRKCLAKKREERYSSVRELVRDLGELQQGRPVQPAAVASGNAAAPQPAGATPAKPGPAAPAAAGQGTAMPVPQLSKAPSGAPSRTASAPPPRPAAPTTPDVPAPGAAPETQTARTLTLRVPNLAALSSEPTLPEAPAAASVPPAMAQAPLKTARPAPFASPPSQAQRPQPAAPPFTPQPPVAGPAAGAVKPPLSKSPIVLALACGVALAVIAGAGYWKYHRAGTAAAPQIAQPSPVPSATQAPAGQANSAPATTLEQAPAPPPEATASAASPLVKKAVVRKPKRAAVPPPHPAEPAAPVQPPPAATPAPTPPPATPSAEDIAKAEAARLAKLPRVVQVACSFDLKEATLVFSAGGQPIIEEYLRGKKIKEGFLGIKGSYQGTFSSNITLPAGTSQLSVRVSIKDGAKYLDKTIPMPPPGGFVPTLAIEVENEQLYLNWKGSSAGQ